ncbi:MAG TPA: hypothetical protein VGJ93_13490 [Desulfuromonadaceae bacterium]
MSLKKTIAIAAAAGALAAISIPAMALENEFHGMYNLRAYLSNVDNGTPGPIDPTVYNKNTKANNYFEQRARLQYIAKASDDLKLVTHFELDTKFGGQGGVSYKSVAGNNDSGQIDADSLTLETKNVYLDFNLGKSVNVKTGIQPVSDKFKGIFLSAADLTGIMTTTKLDPLTLSAGYFRIQEGIVVTGNSNTGQANFDIALLDAQFNISKDVAVGAEYILASDYRSATPETVHTLGLYGSAKAGAATLSGFAAAQTGIVRGANTGLAAGSRVAKSGYAANVAAKVAAGPGTAKIAYLFTSGDDNKDKIDTAWFAIQNKVVGAAPAATSVSSYNEGGMMLLNRNTLNSIGSTDRNLIFNMGGDNAPGFSLLTLGYDASITPKLFANVNAGMAFASKNKINNKNASNLLGTELNVETGYKVYDNLTAKVQLAYVMLGGYYHGDAADKGADGSKPANPYTTRVVLQYAF